MVGTGKLAASVEAAADRLGSMQLLTLTISGVALLIAAVALVLAVRR